MKLNFFKFLLVFALSITSYAQVANQPSPLNVCDDDNDGFATFDLTILDAEVLGTQNANDYTVTYHELLSHAENGIDAISSPYNNLIANALTLYIRLEENSTNNVAITTVDLFVNPTPIPIQPTPLEVCSIEGLNNSFAIFDLTLKDDEITGGNSNLYVTYHGTSADAANQVNPYPTTYVNTSNPVTLFVAVTGLNTYCVGLTTLTLRVLPIPSPTPSGLIPDLGLCDDTNTGDNTETFDLTENEPLIYNGEVELSITYYVSESDAISANNAILDPTQFNNTVSPQTIYVKVTNDTTGCFALVNFNIIVDPEPEVNLGMSEQNYCGFDTVTLNANSPFADEFIWYMDGFLISGETSSALILTESGSYQVQTFNSQCGTSALSEPVSLNLYEDVGTINSQNLVEGCDNLLANGSVDFDLEALTASLGFGSGFTVSYYNNNNDANQAINTLSSPYNSFGETLIMRVEDTDALVDGFLGCRELSLLELVVDCEDSGIIDVSAFFDVNENSIFDTSETNFTNGYITYEINNDGVIYTTESSSGRFTIISPDEANTYDINYYFYDENCFDTSIASFEDISVLLGGDVTVEFPIIEAQLCEDISVNLINQQAPRPGFNHANLLEIKNLGSAITSGTVDYILDEHLIINSITEGIGYSTTLNSNGFSLDFIGLLPQESITVSISLLTSTSVSLGTLVTNTVTYTTSTNDMVSDNNESSISEVVIGSYDPNDKMESHGPQILYDDFVTSDEYLYYTIRFQNVGTAEAINVRIEDILDTQLDASTFQMLRSSHDYVVTRIANNLEWNFDNINLPEEQNDAEGSNGFVYFKIKPNAGYAIGDVIENSASIYFDFNAPIITNTFQTEFVETLSVTSFEAVNFTIYPNPAKDEVTIQLVNSNFETGKVNLYNIQGKVILKDIYIQEHASSIDISSLESGLYFVELIIGNTATVKKLIVN
mgnify:CR=1 FL=1|tara:strand:+ start:6487 stop:9327 length:2841 start_codon:yes stop_codon:yes gene_type:complete